MTKDTTVLEVGKIYSMADITLNHIVSQDVTGSREKPRTDVSKELPDSPDEEYSSGSDRSLDDEGGGEPSESNAKRCLRGINRHGSHGSRRRHKGGSRHKKSFQPYPPQEDTNANLKRRSMDRKEKEFAAAEVRKDASHEGVKFPVAPFNSTQFIMDEHYISSPYGLPKTPSSSRLACMDSPQQFDKDSEVPMDSVELVPADFDLAQQKKDKEFVDIFMSVHAESLQSLPKDELVKHYMGLEEKVAALQKQMAEVKKRKLNGDLREKKDSVSGSDSNSLSSGNEDYINLSSVKHPSISVGDCKD